MRAGVLVGAFVAYLAASVASLPRAGGARWYGVTSAGSQRRSPPSCARGSAGRRRRRRGNAAPRRRRGRVRGGRVWHQSARRPFAGWPPETRRWFERLRNATVVDGHWGRLVEREQTLCAGCAEVRPIVAMMRELGARRAAADRPAGRAMDHLKPRCPVQDWG